MESTKEDVAWLKTQVKSAKPKSKYTRWGMGDGGKVSKPSVNRPTQKLLPGNELSESRTLWEVRQPMPRLTWATSPRGWAMACLSHWARGLVSSRAG